MKSYCNVLVQDLTDNRPSSVNRIRSKDKRKMDHANRRNRAVLPSFINSLICLFFSPLWMLWLRRGHRRLPLWWAISIALPVSWWSIHFHRVIKCIRPLIWKTLNSSISLHPFSNSVHWENPWGGHQNCPQLCSFQIATNYSQCFRSLQEKKNQDSLSLPPRSLSQQLFPTWGKEQLREKFPCHLTLRQLCPG